MINLLETSRENLIAAKISGNISKEDVHKLHPLIDEIIEKYKKVDFYFELHEFHGYDPDGFWADLKLDVKHLSDYGKMAVIGEKKWQKWATQATDLFTGSEVRFFDLNEMEFAKTWIKL